MDKSDTAKDEKMDKPDTAKKPSISESAARFVDAAYETYFEPRKTPMWLVVRMAFAWLGSVTMFVFSPEILKLLSQEKSLTLLFHDINMTIAALTSAIFATVIAAAETKHGPVRLFLFGMMLTAFVLTLANQIWGR